MSQMRQKHRRRPSSSSNTTGLDRIAAAIRANPEGILLVGAACALFMRKGSSWATRSRPGMTRSRPAASAGQPAGRTQTGPDWSESASAAVPDWAEGAADAAASYMSAAQERASDMTRTTYRHTSAAMQEGWSSTQGLIRRTLDEQPLAIAIAGLGVGLAVAAVLPTTRLEQETFEPAGEQISDAVGELRQRLTQAGSSAAQRLMQTADEKGLNADGLKDVMREIASTLQDNLAGEADQSSGTNKPRRGGTSSNPAPTDRPVKAASLGDENGKRT